MNKSNVISLLAALIFAACTSTPKSYVIEGVVPDASYNGQMVYIFDNETRKNTDSTLVVDGKFTFTGTVEAAIIRRFVLNQLSVDFILENGKISVNMDDPASIKGTPMNNELSKFQAEMAAYRKASNEKDDEQYRANVEALSIRFFNANKNNVLGTFILWNSPISKMPDLLESLYAQAGDVVRKFKPLQSIIETNANLKKTAEGMTFTDFTIANGNMDGSKVSLSDYVGKGKYVLADFWASWCGPCIAEIPILVEVYNKYKGERFEVLGIAVWDKREDTMKSIESHNTAWPQILDTGDVATSLYGVSMIPHIILFGPDGTIVARGLRGERLKAKVEEVMCDCNW